MIEPFFRAPPDDTISAAGDNAADDETLARDPTTAEGEGDDILLVAPIVKPGEGDADDEKLARDPTTAAGT